MEGVAQEGGRRTRAALAELPVHGDIGMEGAPRTFGAAVALERLRVTPAQAHAAHTVHVAHLAHNGHNGHTVTPLRAHNAAPVLPAGYLSPAASPDEMLIQQRGRKRLPVTWSPDIEIKRTTPFHSIIRTPPKITPQKLGVTLRSTPRKRLLLGDIERVPLTPEKIDFSDISTPQKFKLSSPVKGTPVKRPRLERSLHEDLGSPIDTALKGLSPVQLITMIKTIASKHPDIEHEIRSNIPAPDLAPIEEKLSYLKSNIFKSLPTSRLTSKTDSPAYSRVATHLAAFKKCVLEQGKVLVESQHWDSVLKYVILAWSYVKATPVWDVQTHNLQRKQCFKGLTNFCMTALKKGGLGKEMLVETQDKLQDFIADSEDVQSCLKMLQSLLRDAQ